MNQNCDVTPEILQYRQCLLAVWQSFCRQYDVESDWDLCDLFADIASDIFDLYFGSYQIPRGSKAKQYDRFPQPIKSLQVVPSDGNPECFISQDSHIWEKCDIKTVNGPFYWVDFYDYQVNDPNRPFAYILAKNADIYLLFHYHQIKIICRNIES